MCTRRHALFLDLFRWLDKYPEFREKYARAKELQVECLISEAIDIADTPQEGTRTKTLSDGRVEIIRCDVVERSRLMVDIRKWYAAKTMPKKYGERLAQEISGSERAPLVPPAIHVHLVKGGEEPK